MGRGVAFSTSLLVRVWLHFSFTGFPEFSHLGVLTPYWPAWCRSRPFRGKWKVLCPLCVSDKVKKQVIWVWSSMCHDQWDSRVLSIQYRTEISKYPGTFHTYHIICPNPFVLPKQEFSRLRTQNHWVGTIPELYTSPPCWDPSIASPPCRSNSMPHWMCHTFWGATGQYTGEARKGRKGKTHVLKSTHCSDLDMRSQQTTFCSFGMQGVGCLGPWRDTCSWTSLNQPLRCCPAPPCANYLLGYSCLGLSLSCLLIPLATALRLLKAF